MTTTTVPDFLPVLPEIFLGVSAMALLMVGAFRGERSAQLVTWLSIAALVVTMALVLWVGGGRKIALDGMFITDGFGAFMKLLAIGGSALAVLLAFDYNRRRGIARFEYPVLILLATTGMMMMISAHDFIALYLALELQNLALYVVTSFERDSVRSTEAGLKYFVLGALASGMLLFGISLIYGFTGTTDFESLQHAIQGGDAAHSIGIVFGIVFIVVGLAFKASAVPFHMWTPDVYEGAPTPVTALLSVAPKVAAIALFLRVMLDPFHGLTSDWWQVIWAISVASMILGSLAAIAQHSIKRLMAYSSIGHVGYALIGLAAGTDAGVAGVLFYMAIYVIMNVGAFGAILCMRRDGKMVEEISDLSGLARTRPGLAAAFGVFMFSLAGVPPLAGFLGKFYIFLAAIDARYYGLAIIGVVTSVVGAYYYLRIVKVMFFDEPAPAFDRPTSPVLGTVLAVSALLVLLFFIYPAPIADSAKAAAATLFAG
ncbi:MAG TPA: NADH-quinone oxidoreductase subunit NuoN [Stellaceae bacterium]|nr:NADH-quinone oxidoreductase subunit NuoN [Stellaceae bacterium]